MRKILLVPFFSTLLLVACSKESYQERVAETLFPGESDFSVAATRFIEKWENRKVNELESWLVEAKDSNPDIPIEYGKWTHPDGDIKFSIAFSRQLEGESVVIDELNNVWFTVVENKLLEGDFSCGALWNSK